MGKKKDDKLEYNMKPTKRLMKALKPGEETGHVAIMSPKEYLNHANRLPDTKEDNLLIDAFKERMEKGKKFKPLKLLAHNRADGRHRATAAEELGIKEVPVIDYRKSGIKNMKGIHSVGKKGSKVGKVKDELRKERASGGPVLPLGDDDPNAAFRRLISWSFAVAPLFHRADGGAVNRHGYATDGGVMGDVQFAPDDQQVAIDNAVTSAKSLYTPAREATMSSYEPTIGEKIYGALAGLSSERPSPERRQFAEGVKEIAGFTPGIGNVMAAEEAQRAGQRGDYGQMALAALGALPAIGPAEKKAAEAAEKAIIAYHGSPHSFDKFDISKIGTGEGAQAYGHGLYFADNEKVAKEYQDRLSDAVSSPTRWFLKGVEAAPNSPEAKAASIVKELGPAKASKFAERTVDQFAQDPRMTQELAFWQSVKDLLGEGVSKKDVGQKFGNMYQVKINADPEHFLDWDKPLSEQSPVVRQALGWTPDAEAKYKAAQAADDDALLAALEGTGDYTASKLPVPEGLPPLSATGAEIARGSSLFDRASDVAKAARLKEAGIPGIKYLDQGSRGAGEGSRNYVVFDDAIVEIMKKYGLVGAAGAALAAKMLQQQQGEEGAATPKMKDGGSIINKAIDVIRGK